MRTLLTAALLMTAMHVAEIRTEPFPSYTCRTGLSRVSQPNCCVNKPWCAGSLSIGSTVKRIPDPRV